MVTAFFIKWSTDGSTALSGCEPGHLSSNVVTRVYCADHLDEWAALNNYSY